MLGRTFTPPSALASLPSLLRRAVGRGGVLGVVLAAGLGCGNISLSSAVDSPAPAGGSPASRPDAALDAGGAGSAPADGASTITAPGASDAAASASSGNPLCFYSFALDADVAHTCQPDTPPPSNQCPGDDAGAYIPPSATDAGDGGTSDIGPACHVVAKGQKCRPLGPGGDGAQCQTGTDCAVSFECVGSPGKCRHYCCDGNAACDRAAAQTKSATFCDVEAMTEDGMNVPVCEPITNCTPLLAGTGAGTCPNDQTCAVVKDDGTTSCLPIGNVDVHGDCSVSHCAANLTCLGSVGSRTCFKLCNVDSPATCPKGTTCTSSAQLFTNANIGICQ